MTSKLLNKAGMALFERHLEQYAPADPMYETYTDSKGKQKRRRVCLNYVLAFDFSYANHLGVFREKYLPDYLNEMQKSSNPSSDVHTT